MTVFRVTTFLILILNLQIWGATSNAWIVCVATKVKKVSFIGGDNRRWTDRPTDASQRQQQTRFTPLKSLAISNHF